jgi:DNA 3'-phosphatase
MWQETSNYLLYIPNIKISNKIAFFDLDGTLITRANGLNPKYPEKDSNNWLFLGNVIDVLYELQNNNYQILIITNQMKFSEIIYIKIKNILSVLNENKLYPIIFISISDSIYRKPNIGILDILNIKLNQNSFMCGDSIGIDDPYPPYRWNTFDSKFAENLSIKLVKPIDLFPTNIVELSNSVNENIIIMVGNMGSHKSTFSSLLKERQYLIIESDIIKNEKKMIKISKNYLNLGNKIVIDATNPTILKRKIWIDLADEFGVSVRIVHCIIDGRPFNELRIKKVPEIAYSVYSKKFELPTNKECLVSQCF